MVDSVTGEVMLRQSVWSQDTNIQSNSFTVSKCSRYITDVSILSPLTLRKYEKCSRCMTDILILSPLTLRKYAYSNLLKL